MWGGGVRVDGMEDPRQGWLHNEEGTMYLLFRLFPAQIWQLSPIALERSAEKRLNFADRIGKYQANQLVFVDESSVDRRTTYRGRAWAVRGRQATRKTFFCCGRRSVLPINPISFSIHHPFN
jgi:hypothetical protein